MADDHDHQAVYDRSAREWHAHRQSQFPERAWMELILAAVPEGGRLLDLGCGAGQPVAAFFVDAGLQVTGLDQSRQMLAIARQAVPGAHFIDGDMRQLALPECFNAVVAWDSLFHLRANEQVDVIARVAQHLAPGGLFLFTGGDREGEVWGAVSGGPVYHASLSPAGYAAAFEAAGLILRRFIAEDPQTAGRSVWLARKL